MTRWGKWFLLALLSALFLYAAKGKLEDPVAFAQSILRYRLVDGWLALVAALWVPWIEVATALGLWLPRWRAAAIALLAGMLGVFEGALLSAYLRGLDIDCGCFGVDDQTPVEFALVRNLVLAGMLFALWRLDRRTA